MSLHFCSFDFSFQLKNTLSLSSQNRLHFRGDSLWIQSKKFNQGNITDSRQQKLFELENSWKYFFPTLKIIQTGMMQISWWVNIRSYRWGQSHTSRLVWSLGGWLRRIPARVRACTLSQRLFAQGQLILCCLFWESSWSLAAPPPLF